MPSGPFYTYLSDGISFASTQAAGIKTIYAPLCGIDASSLKSAVTPFLSGDIKIDKFHYLTKPASREDLRWPLREFFVFVEGRGVFCLSRRDPPDQASVEIGPLWHKLKRLHKAAGLEISAVNFIPVSGENVELMRVEVKNVSKQRVTFTPTAAIPIFGRALSNKHDHEHVTALLNRPRQVASGVVTRSTMAFNEHGHKTSHAVYYVYGWQEKEGVPVGSFPTVDSFYGDGGTLLCPRAVFENRRPVKLSSGAANGKEVMGALRFKETVLKPGEARSFIIAAGIDAGEAGGRKVFSRFNSIEKFDRAWAANKKYWSQKISSIDFKTGDENFNAWMRWVTLQPVLRRIFGCSFLPDHDYGKGGRGWRDIWQDLLSLILIEPERVRPDLINNCAGIRIDGSNATIIGAGPGEFLADRNAITRVWMDHGAWPWLTLMLYIDQSGDFDILLEPQSYFRDPQLSRTHGKDPGWAGPCGNRLLDQRGAVYEGTVLEHILVQHLTQFFNVGEHNIIALESADWNDGLDMAPLKGESVAFTSLYGANLLMIAGLLEDQARLGGVQKIRILEELLILLDTLGDKVDYDDHQAKRDLLFGKYFSRVQPAVSGRTVEVDLRDLAQDLRAKGRWIFGHLSSQEKIQVKEKGRTYEWFNGYYDNQARRVEGLTGKTVRMTLTGQVFAVMSGMASSQEVEKIIISVDRFLKDPRLGGYRLNTDFGVDHYLQLGRAFGFAYGTKENGSFFSHMNVMYAAALYRRGFARAGFRVLQSIYRMAIDGDRSKIYPGIPEYFDSEGRGMYHYLTGSASWLVLTQLNWVFGVRGARGDLVLHPQLVKEEFDKKGAASVVCRFAGRRLTVSYHNPQKLDAGRYAVKEIFIDGRPAAFQLLGDGAACLPRAAIVKDSLIKVVLG
ncbi:MAG: cellobiose phosphorylase [Candidatus Omnitrophica bacterium]|nr:cellobiose phosphorylase [Candidatus Omnitrophota bacterium]MDE2232058.1 cellobiose phosphorylase [Candidatus Omnitrophota bacterium]